MNTRLFILFAAGLLATASAVPITIDPKNCVQDFQILDWKPQRFGPYVICNGGTVTFRWTGMHGVFQIPTIACPSNFTSGETELYKFLAPASNGGGYVWKTPNTTGHYWITSQWQDDCKNNMIAEVYVVSNDDQPFVSSALRIGYSQILLGGMLAFLVYFITML